jgi:uncharacterized protein
MMTRAKQTQTTTSQSATNAAGNQLGQSFFNATASASTRETLSLTQHTEWLAKAKSSPKVNTTHAAVTASTKLLIQSIEVTMLQVSLNLYYKAIETLKHSQQLQKEALKQLNKVTNALKTHNSDAATQAWQQWQGILSELADDSHTVYSANQEKLNKLGLTSVVIPLEMISSAVPSPESLQYFTQFWQQQASQLNAQVDYLENKQARNQVMLENHEASNVPLSLTWQAGTFKTTPSTHPHS